VREGRYVRYRLRLARCPRCGAGPEGGKTRGPMHRYSAKDEVAREEIVGSLLPGFSAGEGNPGRSTERERQRARSERAGGRIRSRR